MNISGNTIMKSKFILFIMLLLSSFCSLAGKTAEKPLLHIQCGDIGIFLAPHLFWNLNGITCKDLFPGRQDHGFYGTVIRYDVGWVGTGHLENGIGETDLKVEFTRDGKPFTPGEATVECKSFTMTKRSKLHHAELVYQLKLADGVLAESAALHFPEKQDLKIIYNFMHPWHNSFEDYRVLAADGRADSGNMPRSEKGKMITFAEPMIASFYSKEWNMAVVSRVSAEPGSPLGDWLFWNRGEQDRKMYFRPLFNAAVPAGSRFKWSMQTVFHPATPAEWNKLDIKKCFPE